MYKFPSVTGGLVTAIISSCLNLNLYSGDKEDSLFVNPKSRAFMLDI